MGFTFLGVVGPGIGGQGDLEILVKCSEGTGDSGGILAEGAAYGLTLEIVEDVIDFVSQGTESGHDIAEVDIWKHGVPLSWDFDG